LATLLLVQQLENRLNLASEAAAINDRSFDFPMEILSKGTISKVKYFNAQFHAAVNVFF
jgi:hypothetical protein